MTFGARDFASEVRMCAWQTSSNEYIFTPGDSGIVSADGDSIFEPSLEDHEHQDAQEDLESGHAAFLLKCRHAVPYWSAERLRVNGPWYCGFCGCWEQKAAR